MGVEVGVMRDVTRLLRHVTSSGCYLVVYLPNRSDVGPFECRAYDDLHCHDRAPPTKFSSSSGGDLEESLGVLRVYLAGRLGVELAGHFLGGGDMPLRHGRLPFAYLAGNRGRPTSPHNPPQPLSPNPPSPPTHPP